jgi:hypothetical protein
MNISNAALTIYVTTEVMNLAALTVDFLFIKENMPSITEISTKYPIIGTIIMIFQCVSPISLGMHFWYYKYNEDENNSHV